MAIQIITWNVNGLRAVWKKGFLDFLNKHKPDLLALQETKISAHQLTEEMRRPLGYHSYFHSAERPGYSGVALYSRKPLDQVSFSIDKPAFDKEGRVIFAKLKGFTFFNVYFPNGGQGEIRLKYKLRFYKYFLAYVNALRKKQPVVITGDFNTAHNDIDLKNPKANENISGFMPVERKWIDRYEKEGLLDIYRLQNPGKIEYTWWTYRFKARERNVGWRLDYYLADKKLAKKIQRVQILGEVRGSDHCPVKMDVEAALV